MKKCIKCNSMLEDDELFCHECGTKQEIGEAEVKNCIHCGETIESDCMFCPYCGKPQMVENIQAKKPTVPDKKKCIHCGETIESDSTFCPFCGKSQVVKNVKSEASQDQIHAETHQIEDFKVDEPLQEEEPTYEWEEEKKSKTWIWILLVLLVAGGVVGYYFMNDSSSDTVEEIVEASDSIVTSPVVDENVPTSALAFLDQFYKGKYGEDDYIKEFVTANVINKLKNDFPYDCPSNDCLATWVFTAYPAGADLDLEEGPIITKTDTEGKFKVAFKYSGYHGSQKSYETRTVYLTVTEMGGKYMICDYEFADDETIEEKVTNKTGEEEFDEAAMMDNLAKRNLEANGLDENGE